MTHQLPVIDLEPWFAGDRQQRLELCRKLRHVCHEIGFFYVVNHGIPLSVSEVYLAMLKNFFALPEDTKKAIDKSSSPQFRGWEKLGSELTNNQVDYREQIDIGVDRNPLPDPDPYYMALVGPNQWPSEATIPGFRETVDDYFSHLSGLSRQILRMMSLALDLEEFHIEQVFGLEQTHLMLKSVHPRLSALDCTLKLLLLLFFAFALQKTRQDTDQDVLVLKKHYLIILKHVF